MSKETTNVDFGNNGIVVNVGEVIADPERGKTQIPPDKSGSKESPENEEPFIIKLEGKWVKNKGNKEEETR